MDRRRFLVSALGAGTAAVAGPWLGTAAAVTEDDLVFANFGVATEFLLGDFYGRAIEARVLDGAAALAHGRLAARRHARALSALISGAGDTPPRENDFAFAWPARVFASASTTTATGLRILNALRGCYQTACAEVSEPSHRVLYASLAASVGQQIGALGGVEPFPVAVDLEAASAAVESYLG